MAFPGVNYDIILKNLDSPGSKHIKEALEVTLKAIFLYEFHIIFIKINKKKMEKE